MYELLFFILGGAVALGINHFYFLKASKELQETAHELRRQVQLLATLVKGLDSGLPTEPVYDLERGGLKHVHQTVGASPGIPSEESVGEPTGTTREAKP